MEKLLEVKNKYMYPMLDELCESLFPKDGHWYSNCFRESSTVSLDYLPSHLRDEEWMAELLIKEYELGLVGKDYVVNYMKTSPNFKKLRDAYEQEIVKWQINWMYNGGDNWICEDDFYVFSKRCDEIFRNGIYDTLVAIGMDSEVIERGIEENVDIWREGYIRSAFSNIYDSVRLFSFNRDENKKPLSKPSEAHFENWRRLRLYEYYMKHKASVDKYGEVLPEMMMTDEEVKDLKTWLEIEGERRLKEIEEYKADGKSIPCATLSVLNLLDSDNTVAEKEGLKMDESNDKPKSLLKRFINRKK